MSIQSRIDALSRKAHASHPIPPPMTPKDIADAERIARRWGDPDSDEYKERVREHERQAQLYNDARRKHINKGI